MPTARPPNNYERRLEQLTRDGLIGQYRPAATYKRELFPAQDVAPPPPLLGGFGCKREFFARHDNLAGTIPASGVFVVENCHVGAAGTLLDRERKVLYAEDLQSEYWMGFLGRILKSGEREHPLARAVAGDDDVVRHLDGGGATIVSLARQGPRVYGHWILDVLPGVHSFVAAARAGVGSGPFRFLVPASAPAWAHRLLAEAFCITPEQVVTFDDEREVVHVDRVIVPSALRASPLISPRMNDYVDELFARLSVAPRDDLPRRIYLPRPAWRVMRNPGEIEAVAHDAGFTTIAPETLPWPEQLALFAGAEIVAGEFGSALHNMLFSPASTVGVVLHNSYSNWTQSGIAALRRQELIYVKPASDESTGFEGEVSYTYHPDIVREALALALDNVGARAS